MRSDSPGSRNRCDSAGSDSGTSEISACSVEKVYSKYSPLYVKPEFKQGSQVLATRPQLRYNPRPARSKLTTKSTAAGGARLRGNTARSDSYSDSNDHSDSNTNTTSRDDEENDSSEESEFVQKLMDFHEAQDSQIPKVFWLGLKRASLWTIYQKVKQLGGYDTVIEQKMWKYLFGIDGGYNTISRKKYERAILPYERFEQKCDRSRNGGLNGTKAEEKGPANGGGKLGPANISPDRHFTHSEIAKIQEQIRSQSLDPDLHVKMASGVSYPVTVIVGGPQREPPSPSHIQIQQPHTTITVHQTTIHPQTLKSSQSKADKMKNAIQITNQIQIQQITVQPTAGTSCSIKQDANGQEVHLSEREFSMRNAKGKVDRSKDLNGSRRSSMTPLSLGSVTVSAIKPNEKENIPYLAGSKTTTITPILGNSNKPDHRLPSTISEIIDLVDSDNESNSSTSPAQPSNTIFPNMKKRKLDILRQGGLEVTAINNAIGPLSSHSFGARPQRSVNNIVVSATPIDAPPADTPAPMFQSKCMYVRTSRIFGNPKDMIPTPSQAAELSCIDLTVHKLEAQGSLESLRLPPTTTIKRAQNPAPSFSPPGLPSTAALAAHKITDPNLQITLVPPLTHTQHVHNSQNHNIKRKSSESEGGGTEQPPEKRPAIPSTISISTKQNDLSISTTIDTSASKTLVPNFSLNDLKLGQMMLQNFFNSSHAGYPPGQLPPQFSTKPPFPLSVGDEMQKPSPPTYLPPPMPGPNQYMPMYMSPLCSPPSLFYPQTIPQELIQLYKNFPQGLGVIPISKS